MSEVSQALEKFLMRSLLPRLHLVFPRSRAERPAESISLLEARKQNAFFSTHPPFLSGHSRWSKIKHDKGAADDVKNKQRTVLAKEIQTVSRLYGPDPNSNPRLSALLTQAKRIGFPTTRITAAINRGQGISASGLALEPLTLELLLPPTNVALIVECLTDNQSRTRQDVAEIMKKFGARDGSVKWMFERVGRLQYRAEVGRDQNSPIEVGEEQILDWAIEAGAEDVEYLASSEEDDAVGEGDEEEEDLQSTGDRATVWTQVEDLVKIREDLGLKMEGAGWKEQGMEILWRPKEDAQVEVGGKDADELREFVKMLSDDLAVQDVYLNACDF